MSDSSGQPGGQKAPLAGGSGDEDRRESVESAGGGENIQRINVYATGENLDEDAQRELKVRIEGLGHGDYENYRFDGRMDYLLSRNAGDYTTEHWVAVKNGSLAIASDEFENEMFPRFVAYFDDDVVIDGEAYRLEFTVTVAGTNRSFSDVEEFTFFDDGEAQATPPREFPDQGGNVTRLSVWGTSENADGDYHEEIVLSIRGEDPEGDEYRFAAQGSILLEKEEGPFGEETYREIGQWEVNFSQNEFTDSYSPAFEFTIDHEELEATEEYESYRVTVTLVLEATGETVSDRDEVFYSSG